MPNTFIFDLAGVLITWNPLPFYRRFFDSNESKVSEFFTTVLNGDVQTAIGTGEPVDEVLENLAGLYPDYADAVRAYRSNWLDLLEGPIGGSVSVLGELRERGYRTFALGNWSRSEFEWVVDRFEFLQGFDDILLSGDCGIMKPDPGIYALAEDRFSLTPAETVFIDDRLENVQTAVSRGWNGIVFESPRQLYLTLMEYKLL